MWLILSGGQRTKAASLSPTSSKKRYFFLIQISNTAFSYDSLLWLFYLKLWGFWLQSVLIQIIKYWRFSLKKRSLHIWSSYPGHFCWVTSESINTQQTQSNGSTFSFQSLALAQPVGPQSTRNTPKARLLLRMFDTIIYLTDSLHFWN